MPGNKTRIPRFLDEKAAAPGQNIGADHLLYRIEHTGMADEFVEPCEKEMRLVAEAPGQAAVAGLEGFETGAQTDGLVAGQGPDRSIIPLIVELTDGVRRHCRHALLLIC